jgi:hypothetical protein
VYIETDDYHNHHNQLRATNQSLPYCVQLKLRLSYLHLSIGSACLMTPTAAAVAAAAAVQCCRVGV